MDQYENLERKFAQTLCFKQKEISEIRDRNKRRNRLLGAHFLTTKTDNIVKLRMKYYFDSIRNFLSSKQSMLQGLITLRKILKRSRM